MQIVHVLVENGEGKIVVEHLESMGVEIEDYKLISSDDGDLVIINLLYGNKDILIDNLRSHLSFDREDTRSMIIFSPDTVIPRDEEKVKKESYRATRESLVTFAKESASLDSHFIALVIFSAVIATLGLILDNVAILVGGMVIAPVLGPILAMTIGIVLGNYDLIKRGFVAELLAALVAIFIGVIFGYLVPNVELTQALQIRTRPTIADLLIAGAAGSAGAYTLLAKGAHSQLVGVMVAASLVPVMGTIGVGITMENPGMVYGAGLLLLANYMALLLAIIATFYFKGLKPQIWYEARASSLVKRSLIITFIVVVLLSIPLGVITYEEFMENKPKERIEKVITESFSHYPAFKLSSISFHEQKVNIFFYSSADVGGDAFKNLKREIHNRTGGHFPIVYEVVFTERIY